MSFVEKVRLQGGSQVVEFASSALEEVAGLVWVSSKIIVYFGAADEVSLRC
jgi:hypothetical protein